MLTSHNMMTSSIYGVSLFVLIILQFASRTKAVAPILSGLPTQVRIGELETGSRFIYEYAISDANGDSYTCEIDIAGELAGAAAADNDNEFLLKRDIKTGKYELWTNSAALDVDIIDTYVITITCTDSNNEVSTGVRTLDVVIVPNEQLTINNVEGTANDLTLNALNTGSTVTVKTVSSTSQGGNPVQYSLVSDPSFTPEFFTIDSSTGAIKTNRELQYLDAGTSTVYLTVTAYDTVEQIRTQAVQTVHLTNQNTIPATTNMITPLKESKIETMAEGEILFSVSVEDPDSQSYTYRYSCNPLAGEDTFTLDANGNFAIASGETMDYESIPFFNCSFYIHDGIAEGGPFVYELTVVNDNEPPYFSDVMYYATTTEGSKGSVSFDPGFTCTDPDTGDSTTYDFTTANNSDRFAINSAGIMTFNTDYNVDNNAMPSNVILTVCCVDSGHIDGVSKSGCTQVTVTISDVNDNAPEFSSSAYSFNVDQTVAPGSVIGTIIPTDADSGTNADVTCDSTATSSFSSYYTIGADCNVYLSKTIDFDSGTHVGYTAFATDNGSPQLTGTAGVSIVYQEILTTTTTTTTTTQAYNFFDHDVNIALFTLALLMGLAMLGFLTWCLMKLCCASACASGGMCDCSNMCDCRNQGRTRPRRIPRRAITPESPPPPPRKRPPPQIIEEQPRQLIKKPVQMQLVRTIARPMHGFRGLPPPQQFPQYPIIRTAPTLPGYFP